MDWEREKRVRLEEANEKLQEENKKLKKGVPMEPKEINKIYQDNLTARITSRHWATAVVLITAIIFGAWTAMVNIQAYEKVRIVEIQTK